MKCPYLCPVCKWKSKTIRGSAELIMKNEIIGEVERGRLPRSPGSLGGFIFSEKSAHQKHPPALGDLVQLGQVCSRDSKSSVFELNTLKQDLFSPGKFTRHFPNLKNFFFLISVDFCFCGSFWLPIKSILCGLYFPLPHSPHILVIYFYLCKPS